MRDVVPLRATFYIVVSPTVFLHRASDWTEQMAVVRVQVSTRGRDVLIKLFRTDNGKLIAVAPVRPDGPAAVEQVIDSSRYFALRVENASGACGLFLVCGAFRMHALTENERPPPPLPPPPSPLLTQATPPPWALASTSERTRST